MITFIIITLIIIRWLRVWISCRCKLCLTNAWCLKRVQEIFLILKVNNIAMDDFFFLFKKHSLVVFSLPRFWPICTLFLGSSWELAMWLFLYLPCRNSELHVVYVGFACSVNRRTSISCVLGLMKMYQNRLVLRASTPVGDPPPDLPPWRGGPSHVGEGFWPPGTCDCHSPGPALSFLSWARRGAAGHVRRCLPACPEVREREGPGLALGSARWPFPGTLLTMLVLGLTPLDSWT